MNVNVPDGQKCQWRGFIGCGEDADYGLVALPGGGLVLWICGYHVDRLCVDEGAES